MPSGSDGGQSAASDNPITGSVSNQLAVLVPSFDPGKDDLQVYQQKVALLLEAWPPSKYTELATRLILNCVGSAFQKLQLHQAEVMLNERKSIQRIIEILGGHWGQIDLEKKYEFAERALYKCVQKSDESADSSGPGRHHVDGAQQQEDQACRSSGLCDAPRIHPFLGR